jgi:hypothetical protein
MAYFGKLGGLMRQTVARSLLQKAGAAGTGSVALPAVFLLQRGMASSKLFIGGEFPLSLSLSLRFFSFLLHSSIRFRLFGFVSLSLRESLKRRRREDLPIEAVHCQTLNLGLLISISRVHLFVNV